MNIKIVSELLSNVEEMKEEIKYIKKKDFTNLKVQIELDMQEVHEMMEQIIYDDTQINLLESDILIEDLERILNSEDVEYDEEYKYIKNTLCKTYSPGILKDAVQYVLQLTCDTEIFYKSRDKYGTDLVIFEMNLEDFENDNSKIMNYIR